MKNEIAQTDPLTKLKTFTAARIALGRTGTSIPLKQSLEFKLAHAHARDAVYSVLETDSLTDQLKIFDIPVLLLHSRAANRQKYLTRPDRGRRLNDESSLLLKNWKDRADVAIVIADGLSATAVNENAFKLLEVLIPLLRGAGLQVAPFCLVEQGRVAIADDITFALNAKLSLILIGERPGLSAADSMGAYLTYDPKPGFTDESRNCISNIRPEGLSHQLAAEKIFYLIQEAFRRKLSGVALKDNAGLLTDGHPG